MLQEGRAIGTIAVTRPEAGPFLPDEIAMLQTFADQAVIAIENVRLFTELEQRNRDLTESLDRQTATSEILRVMSNSPTDLRPVFEDAHANISVEDVARWRRDIFPYRPARESVIGRAVLEKAVVHVHDIQGAPDYIRPGLGSTAFRTGLAVPMLKSGECIGVLGLWRSDVRPFTNSGIGLIQTFADQAVIAIENVRLFTELQQKNRALTQAHAQVTEALEQQTATSEVLKVISRSTFDLQPVLDTLVENAARLCGASTGILRRFDGEVFRLTADYGLSAEARDFWE